MNPTLKIRIISTASRKQFFNFLLYLNFSWGFLKLKSRTKKTNAENPNLFYNLWDVKVYILIFHQFIILVFVIMLTKHQTLNIVSEKLLQAIFQ